MTDPAEDELEALRRRVDELESVIEAQRIERDHTALRHRDYVLGIFIESEAATDRNRLLNQRISRLRARLDDTTRQTTRREGELRAELDNVYRSRTWRAGRLLTRPLPGRRP